MEELKTWVSLVALHDVVAGNLVFSLETRDLIIFHFH